MDSANIKPYLTRANDEVKQMFYLLDTKADIAELLEIPLNRLAWHLHVKSSDSHYALAEIPKKSGGYRKIEVPVSALKLIQSKLNHVLQLVYSDHKKSGVHGFSKGTSIVTNASAHKNASLVLNLDLQNFFPSITFGRVRGIFQKPPYNLNEGVATTLAQICCYQKRLPQGAPTSPIVSNIVCARLDTELKRLAASGGCTYSRYGDDITFSTNRKKFLKAIVVKTERRIEPGSELSQIIRRNGFKINQRKVWYCSKEELKTVTGITVHSDRLNVSRRYYRSLRTLLFQWKEFGYDAARRSLMENYHKHRSSDTQEPRLEHVVRGRIEFFGMVRGHDDTVYQSYLKIFNELRKRDC